jgi:hypothetical protein
MAPIENQPGDLSFLNLQTGEQWQQALTRPFSLEFSLLINA